MSQLHLSIHITCLHSPSPFFSPTLNDPVLHIPPDQTHLMPLLNMQCSSAPIKIQHNPQLQQILAIGLRTSSIKNRTEIIDRLKAERSAIIKAEIQQNQTFKQKQRQENTAKKRKAEAQESQPLTLMLKRQKSEMIVDI